MRNLLKLPSLSNVIAGATATLLMPIGVSYEQVKFSLSGITPAQMKNLKLKINGITVQEYDSAAELQEINGFKGYHQDATGYLTWNFIQPELNAIPYLIDGVNGKVKTSDREITKLGTLDVKTLVIEFDIDAAATTPKVTASAMVSNNSLLGFIKKVRKHTNNASSTGIQEVDNIPTNGARIAAIHFKKSDINSIEVKASNQVVYEAAKIEAREYQRDHDRVPNTDYFHVDWTLTGDSDEALVTAGLTDFRAKLDHANTGAYSYTVEYIDTLTGGV